MLSCASIDKKNVSVYIDVKMNWPNTNKSLLFCFQFDLIYLYECRTVDLLTNGNRSSIIVNTINNPSLRTDQTVYDERNQKQSCRTRKKCMYESWKVKRKRKIKTMKLVRLIVEKLCVVITIILVYENALVFYQHLFPYWWSHGLYTRFFFCFIVGHWLLINTVKHYYLAISKSPGFVADLKKDLSPEDELNYTKCLKCDAMRPPRAHHCKICDKCVLRFDHHCK